MILCIKETTCKLEMMFQKHAYEAVSIDLKAIIFIMSFHQNGHEFLLLNFHKYKIKKETSMHVFNYDQC